VPPWISEKSHVATFSYPCSSSLAQSSPALLGPFARPDARGCPLAKRIPFFEFPVDVANSDLIWLRADALDARDARRASASVPQASGLTLASMAARNYDVFARRAR
jgi:hypothetical protein